MTRAEAQNLLNALIENVQVIDLPKEVCSITLTDKTGVALLTNGTTISFDRTEDGQIGTMECPTCSGVQGLLFTDTCPTCRGVGRIS
jgi:hypothetical protein